MKRSKKWKRCFRLASRHRKSHAGFDRALHACLARSFGAVSHDPLKVRLTSQRMGLRKAGEKTAKLTARFYRYGTGFAAQVCFPKANVRWMSGPLLKRRSHRCGLAHGRTPTAALRGALVKLARATR